MSQPKTIVIKLQEINQIALLEGLPAHDKAALAKKLQFKKFKRGEIVINKGQPPSGLFFLLNGRLKVVDYAANGREIGFVFFEQFAHFGELSLLDNKPCSASIIATEPSTVAFLPMGEARRLIYSTPSISEKLLTQLATVIRKNNEHIVMLGSNNAHSRVCNLLLKQAHTKGGELLIDQLPTHSEIATMTNTTRETVSRTLNRLAEQGHIKKSGRFIVILSKSRLSALSEE